ncbi:peptidoglycan-binding protein [Stieleria sp. ICT_E10.1]|uniref:peptidoglycan-binding domain-containing protein n=1 Tax=Stieleria sedimenti TaxID=2976331 RepID=UPI00217FB775|nr:peptidoglycan-binding domain-containing protein [Stieleria sedimenti]MCS7465440.1 peptidoglycan-binding protein [Stieleria sedimenti]
MNETLARIVRFGSRGEDVVQIQQMLNQARSALPPLVTDGIFGAKSESRTREFQGQHHLGIDGIVGPQTWAELLAQLGNILGIPPVTTLDKAAFRKRVIEEAGKLVGKVDFLQTIDGRPKGLDLVQKMFKDAADVALTDDDFKDPISKAWSPQPYLSGKKKSWCGIFCVYCYHQAGLRSIRWDLGVGAPRGPIALNSWSPQFVQNIQLADIGTVATQQHHFLIEQVDPNSAFTPRLNTIDGNLVAGRIQRRTGYHAVGKDNFNYYSLH